MPFGLPLTRRYAILSTCLIFVVVFLTWRRSKEVKGGLSDWSRVWKRKLRKTFEDAHFIIYKTKYSIWKYQSFALCRSATAWKNSSSAQRCSEKQKHTKISPRICGRWLETQVSFLSVRLKGTLAIGRLNLMPRPGLEPTVRIDICESAALNHFAIKAFCTLRNN